MYNMDEQAVCILMIIFDWLQMCKLTYFGHIHTHTNATKYITLSAYAHRTITSAYFIITHWPKENKPWSGYWCPLEFNAILDVTIRVSESSSNRVTHMGLNGGTVLVCSQLVGHNVVLNLWAELNKETSKSIASRTMQSNCKCQP